MRPMSTLTHWDRHPLGDIPDWLDGSLKALWPGGIHPTRLEICRTDHEFIVRAELPGMDTEKAIEVIAARGVLTIRAERHADKAAWHHSKFRYGTYAQHRAARGRRRGPYPRDLQPRRPNSRTPRSRRDTTSASWWTTTSTRREPPGSPGIAGHLGLAASAQ